MLLRVLAFAQIRELLGAGSFALEVAAGTTAAEVWTGLARERAGLGALGGSTRFAVNGRIVPGASVLRAGDELALLPPVGGG